ncbi:MAG: aldo/keto reductase [Sedimentisphaerales bacterium]|nr:aldo/keto reductase [Sedimentisphaerales bacterium]HNY79573.1 aldo/keto reductase [Sedimentisphaerales bacterium]HOC65472.1 aldo/keto reductase [Sedimentisphaerales bacterium]HOH65584.1 aldo/keto reductase [Sedimentisphaerales bacterium]HPY49458.1 aldo/keto reductase [Sedimentisphaerales bacterium]
MVPRIELRREGPRCSRIVHGLWRLADWGRSEAEIRELLAGCLELGITTFDHADIYGDYTCESLFGRALAASGIERSQIQLVTKCGIKLVSRNRPAHAGKCYDTTAAHIVASAENSLRSLRVDYLDLLLIHRPNPLTDPREVNDAFMALKDSGKVLHFGVSNFLPSQFEMLASKLDVPLVTNQIEYSVMHLDPHADGSLDLCQRLDLRPMAWSPMGGGRLFHEESEQADRLRDVLGRIGRRAGGASMDQVALAWVLMHPAQFVPVLGTGRLSRIRKAVEALGLLLSREQWFEIWCASTGRDVP